MHIEALMIIGGWCLFWWIAFLVLHKIKVFPYQKDPYFFGKYAVDHIYDSFTASLFISAPLTLPMFILSYFSGATLEHLGRFINKFFGDK